MQTTCRISRSCCGRRNASLPILCNKSAQLHASRRDAGSATKSCPRSSVWFSFLELLVMLLFGSNPVLILIPLIPSAAKLRFLLERCPELHGDFSRPVGPCAPGNDGDCYGCKIAANQHRIKPQPQSNLRHLAHGLPAEVGHLNVAALSPPPASKSASWNPSCSFQLRSSSSSCLGCRRRQGRATS